MAEWTSGRERRDMWLSAVREGNQRSVVLLSIGQWQ